MGASRLFQHAAPGQRSGETCGYLKAAGEGFYRGLRRISCLLALLVAGAVPRAWPQDDASLRRRMAQGDLEAMRVLANRQDRSAFEPLRKVAQDPRAPLSERRLALEYLARLDRDPRVVPVLERAVRDKGLRDAAIEAMSQHHREGRGALLNLMRAPPPGRTPLSLAIVILEGFTLEGRRLFPDPPTVAAAAFILGQRGDLEAHALVMRVVAKSAALLDPKDGVLLFGKVLDAAEAGWYPDGGADHVQSIVVFLEEWYTGAYSGFLERMRSSPACAPFAGQVAGIPEKARETREYMKRHDDAEERRLQGDGVVSMDGGTPVLLK